MKNKVIILVTAIIIILFISNNKSAEGMNEAVEAKGNTEKTQVINIAFEIKDDYTNPDTNPEVLAKYLEEALDMPVEIYPITNYSTAIEALRYGHAHFAFLDGGAGWLGWKQHGFEVIAADLKSNGQSYYTAQAMVKKNSGIKTYSDLEGKTSCHTGWLKSAGMIMPMGTMIGKGVVDVVGDKDDLESLRYTIEGFFGNAIIPDSSDIYGGYAGALRCLSDGTGDVAFVKSTTWEDYCGKEDAPDWCISKDNFEHLEAFGSVPSHPVVINPEKTDKRIARMLTRALLSLNDSEEGLQILSDILETDGIIATNTEDHLGAYSLAMDNIPGMVAYTTSKIEK
jgi:phosphonate transport system substrate-binding protein|tara:strand:- start:2407 stop:3426 length:1020 start_codon:yes stop_codon:yes gene_type:complete